MILASDVFPLPVCPRNIQAFGIRLDCIRPLILAISFSAPTISSKAFGRIANASGCSSVWAGTAAFSPLAQNERGQGPAWGRSLFEDAAEYGLGMARAIQTRRENLAEHLQELVTDEEFKPLMSVELQQSVTEWLAHMNDPVVAQEKFVEIPELIAAGGDQLNALPLVQQILDNTDMLPKISPWIWGGDGWAYDIGFGGLDHVLASEEHVNVLVLDTEMYSNTGGQASK